MTKKDTFKNVDYLILREEEENNLPQMKKLFFLYVWLNLTRPECFRDKEDLVKHIRKRTIQTGRLFFSSSLITYLYTNSIEWQGKTNVGYRNGRVVRHIKLRCLKSINFFFIKASDL